jgi:hypothetical protein
METLVDLLASSFFLLFVAATLIHCLIIITDKDNKK